MAPSFILFWTLNPTFTNPITSEHFLLPPALETAFHLAFVLSPPPVLRFSLVWLGFVFICLVVHEPRSSRRTKNKEKKKIW